MKRILIILKYDFINGIIRQLWKYAILGVVAFTAALGFLNRAVLYFDKGLIKEYPSLLETYFYVFKGLEPLRDKTADFQIPFLYGALFLGFAVIIGDYVTKDLENFGQNIIVYSGSRRWWILSKILWNLFAVVTFFLITFVGIFAAYAIKVPQKSYIATHEMVFKKLLSLKMVSESGDNIINACIMMVAAMVVISLMQMTVAFLFSPTVGFGAVVTNVLVSCTVFSPYIIGNYTMLIRGYSLILGVINILILLLIWLLDVAFLVMFSVKKDLLSGRSFSAD